MTRTVKGFKFNYIESEFDEKGEIKNEIKTVEVYESNEKKALKKAIKKFGYFRPVKAVQIEKKYILDDDLFFKYATEVK